MKKQDIKDLRGGQMTKPTPTPWYHNVAAGCIEADGKMICDVGFVNVNPVANGNHIVRCVNNFDALLEACKKGLSATMKLMLRLNTSEVDNDIRIIQAAITEAEKE